MNFIDLEKKYSKNLTELEKIHNDPINFISEYFNAQKNELEVIQGRIRVMVREYFDHLMQKIVKLESECYDNYERLNPHNYDFKKLKEEHNELKINPIPQSQMNFVHNQLLEKNQEILKKLEETKSALLGSNKDLWIYFLEQNLNLKDTCDVIIPKVKNEKPGLISYSKDKTIKEWNVENDCELVRDLNAHKNIVLCAIVLSDLLLVSCSSDYTIKIWDLRVNVCVQMYKKTCARLLTRLGSDQFISGGTDGKIFVWQIRYNEPRLGIQNAHDGHVICMELLPFGKLASGGADKLIKLWDLTNGNCLKVLSDHGAHIQDLCLYLKNNNLVSGSLNKILIFWNLDTLEYERAIHMEAQILKIEKIGKDQLAVLMRDGVNSIISIIDMPLREISSRFKINKPINIMRYYSDGVLVVCGEDGFIEFWNYHEKKLMKSIEAHQDQIRGIYLMREPETNYTIAY